VYLPKLSVSTNFQVAIGFLFALVNLGRVELYGRGLRDAPEPTKYLLWQYLSLKKMSESLWLAMVLESVVIAA
jgi:hypothetical protein